MAKYLTHSIGGIPTSPDGDNKAKRYYVLPSSVSLTSTSPTVITGFSASVEANSLYKITLILGITSGAAGSQFGLNYPGTILRIPFARTNSNTAFTTGSALTTVQGLSAIIFNTTATGTGGVIIELIFKSDGTGGTFEALFASVNGAQTTTVLEQSTMIVEKIISQI